MKLKNYLALENWKLKIHRRQILSFLFSLTAFVLMGVMFLRLTAPSVQAAWFDDSWEYRKAINIPSHTSLETNVYVTVPTFDATDTTRYQSDCGNLRFTDSGGKLLQYYVVDCDATANIHVLFDSLPAGASNYYIYYGNLNVQNGFVSSDFATAATGLGSQTAGSEEQSPGPVSYWSFDEGSASTAQDYSVQNNDLTITNASVKTEDLCVSGKCLGFDGDADRATKSYSTDTELLPGTGSFTVSAWFKHTSTAGADILVSRVDAVAGVGWKLYMNSSGFMCFGIDAVAGTFPNDDACTATSYADSQWHHVTAVKTGTTDIRIYIDASLLDTQTGITGTTLDGTNAPFTVGNDFDNGTNGWDGFIDEVKYYSFAKSTDQVKTEFASRGSVKGVAASFGPDTAKSLSTGLVGYWKMDEGTGTSVTDTSGNGSTGTLYGGASATWVTGKIATSVQLSAGDDLIELGDNLNVGANSSLTISAWVNRTDVTTNYMLISKDLSADTANAGYEIGQDSSGDGGGTCFYIKDGTNRSYVCTNPNATTTLGTWQQVVVTYDDTTGISEIYLDGKIATNTSDRNISVIGSAANSICARIGALGYGGSCDGTDNGNNYSGNIDEVRFYNRALSPAEVAALYAWAPGPVGWWKMDENTGTSSTTDSSGNGLTGSITGPVWNTGKYGSSLSFDGSDDYVYASDNDILDITGTLTVSAWIKRGTDQDDFEHIVIKKADSGWGGFFGAYRLALTSGDNVRFEIGSSGNAFCFSGCDNEITSNSSIPIDGNWYHLAGTFDGSSLRVYINGVLDNSKSSGTSTIGATGFELSLGTNDDTGTEDFSGNIDDVRIYNYARTPKQVVEDMNAGHPAGGSPIASQVAYWALDEQQGQTINNSNSSVSLTANRGTTSGSESQDPTWLLENSCKINGCMDFDATDDVNTVTNANAIDFDVGLVSGLTFSAWIYPDTAGEGSGGRVFSKGTNTWLRVDTLASGRLDLQGSLGLTTTPATLNVSAPVTQSAWNHVALSYTDDSDDEISLWVNGRLVGTSTDGSGTPAVTDTANLLIGNDSAGGETFDGRLDGFKIYSSELTASEILIDANAGSSSALGGTLGTHDNEGFGGNPPQAWWPLNEGSGATTADIGGGGNTGTLAGGPTWTNAKIGKGVSFDGSNDAVTTTFDPTENSDHSVSFWVYPRTLSTDDTFISLNNIDYAFYFSATSRLTLCGETCVDTAESSANPLTLNSWNHVSYTFDQAATATVQIYVNGINVTSDSTSTGGGTSADTFQFGANGCNPSCTNGADVIMDEVRFYNYLLTPAQVAYDYNRGAPVAWYQFDECQGSTAYNAATTGSGTAAGMNGTITPGGAPNAAVGDCSTSASTMWFNGATGKFNSSLGFDNTDDYITVTNADAIDQNVGLLSGLTASAWIYANGAGEGTGGRIFTKNTNTWCRTDTLSGSNLDVECSIDLATDAVLNLSTAITTASWHHVVMTWTNDADDEITVWIDGQNRGTSAGGTPGSGDPSADTANLIIGNDSTSGTATFDGLIDDVRLYPYEMTASQIQRLYNEGSAVRFGPSTGSP